MSRFRWIPLGVGVGLFVWILRSADLPTVWGQLKMLHWWLPVVLAFYGVIFGLDTLGWRFAFRPRAGLRLRWSRLFRARLAGEAVNYVTPTAWVGGEPVKAALLSKRYGIPMVEGMASVVVAKTTFTLSMLLFVGVGLALTALTQPLPAAVMQWVWVVFPFLSVLLALFLLVQFRKPFQRGGQLLGRWIPRVWAQIDARYPAVWHRKLVQWDQAVTSFYRNQPGSLFWSLGFHFLGWVAGAVEVFLILRILQIPVSFSTACAVEALWVLLRSGAFLIPASLGASEGILLLICPGFGISAVAGLALALIRRARELTWVGLGLVEFARGR